MKESISNQIDINDTPVELFRLFLKFLYTGQICQKNDELGFHKLLELYTIGDKYQVEQLQILVTTLLIRNFLNRKNICYLLNFSNHFNIMDLKVSLGIRNFSNLLF